MKYRTLIFFLVFVLGGALVAIVSDFDKRSILGWGILFMLLQFVVLRCHRCGQFAWLNILRNWSQCPHCAEKF